VIRTTTQSVHSYALAALLATGPLSAATAHAGHDPLADLLVNKGVVSAEDVAKLPDRSALPKGLAGMEFEALGFIDYSAGSKGSPGDGSDSFNKFSLTRGYLTVKKEILPWMRARTTMDVHQDGDEDWKVRLKYLYAELRPDDVGPLTQMKGEIGLGHIPWLDFEEHDAKGRTGNSHYDGKYGSWHVGVYNGGGYHAAEKNEGKVYEGRLTIRPLPDIAPGLQVSYLGITGDGNTDPGPDYTVNLGMVSYEHPWFILTGQYFQTTGNASGGLVDGSGDSLDTEAYSFFGNVKLPVFDKRLAAFARYDHFDADKDGEVADDADYDLTLAGLSFDLYHGNMILIDYETVSYGNDSGGMGKAPSPGADRGDDERIQIVYQIKY
jgi:hypothetical protein